MGAWLLLVVGSLLWLPTLGADRTPAGLASLFLYLLVSWGICRVRVSATGTGVEVRTPWRTTGYRWDEVDGFAKDSTGSHLMVLTPAGGAIPISATFTRHLRRQVRSQVLVHWAVSLEAPRLGGAVGSKRVV